MCIRDRGHSILVAGIFSGDPHPGNVLLMPDGRLGLIDYGQCKRISRNVRISLSRAMVALANDDQAEAVRVFRQELGSKTKYGRADIGYRLIALWFDRNTADVLGPYNIQQFLDYCEAEDPSVQTPEETVMAGRVSVMLRGLGNAFAVDFSTAKQWEPIARRVLQEEGVVYVPKKTNVLLRS